MDLDDVPRDGMPALAAQIRRRRDQQRLSQAALAGRGGPGEATVRRIERGELSEVRSRTKVQLEQALSWPDGLVDKILDGTASPEELASTVVRAGVASATVAAAEVTATASHPTSRWAPTVDDLRYYSEVYQRLSQRDRTPAVLSVLASMPALLEELVAEQQHRERIAARVVAELEQLDPDGP